MIPAAPLITIRTSGGWADLNLREFWNYRELLYFLTWRDVRVRYKQTVLGAAWAILQPLASMLIFAVFFGKLAKVPSDGIPYPLFAYAGLLPWTFFSNAITNSGNSLVASTNLVTKVYFPRMIIPASATVAGLVDFGIAFLMLGAMMPFYGMRPVASWVFLPLLATCTALLAMAIGLAFSALNVKYRDVRYALPFVVQLWMFASPVVYPLSLVPERWRWAVAINPMAGLIEGYRAALFGRTFDLGSLFTSLIETAALLAFSAFVFRRAERSFADVI
jgi:lipopolysaccharide transport system permease protein